MDGGFPHTDPPAGTSSRHGCYKWSPDGLLCGSSTQHAKGLQGVPVRGEPEEGLDARQWGRQRTRLNRGLSPSRSPSRQDLVRLGLLQRGRQSPANFLTG